ncbi:MAG: Type 1 glutamine amidotransferase-like domain-containing protein [Chloroflexota bacterium]
MPGPIALVGSGEFTPALEPVDRALLAAVGAARPRVAILPTASAPDGPDVFARWGRMGRDHFQSLGAEVEVVPVATREEAADAGFAASIAGADLVYLSGGKPDFLYDVLAGSAVEAALRAAWERGAALAGCSAGAMVLAGQRMSFGGRVPVPSRWKPGLGFVPGTAVAPHYDRWPETMMAPLVLVAPEGTIVLGIDEETALVGIEGAWTVRGPGRVTVWRGSHRTRHTDGETVTLGS